MITEIIFDVETKKLFSEIETTNPGDLGISIVSAYTRELNDGLTEVSGKMQSFWEKDLDGLFQIFSAADRIIGYNSLKFDIPALQPYTKSDLSKLPHFDIFSMVRQTLGHSLSLDALVTETLGASKSDTGLAAVAYWNNHDPESLRKLQHYCELDVALTRDLYDYGLKNKQIKYRNKWNQTAIIELDFSYPKDILEKKRQIGLF